MKESVSLLAIITFAACGSDTGRGPDTIVRDSAGIRIVESVTPMWQEGQEWHLSPQPVIDIGGGDTDETQLFRLDDATLLSDGRILALNAGTRELRYFAPDGTYLLASGGEGGGPGEFESLDWIQPLAGDSVIAYDNQQRRLSVFDSEGNYLSSFTLERTDDIARPNARDVFADGSLLVRYSSVFTSRSESGMHRSPAALVRYSDDGSAGTNLGSFHGSENFVRAGDGSVSVMDALFGRSTTFFAFENDFYVASNDSYELRRFDQNGRLMEIVRRDVDQKPVTDSDASEWKRLRLEGIPEMFRANFGSMLEEMPIPPTMPSYVQARVDALGNLWVEEYNSPGDNVPRWSVFDTQGAWLGTLEFPRRFEPLEIGDDYVLGEWEDDLDVEHVRLYDLIKP